MKKTTKTPTRKYKPRTEEQKARRRERDRARREASKNRTEAAKAFLKKGGKITPKNAAKVATVKAKKAVKKADPNPKRKLVDKLNIKSVHVIKHGDVIEFSGFPPTTLFDLGRKIMSMAFCMALMDKKSLTA